MRRIRPAWVAFWMVAVHQPATASAPTCTIAAARWSSEEPRSLRTPSGRQFATIVAGDLELTIGQDATLVATTHGIRLRVSVRAADLPIFLREPATLGDVLVAGRGTALDWRAVGDRIHVAARKDPQIRFASTPSLEVACTALTLQARPAQGYNADHIVVARGPVKISAHRGGRPAARVRFAKDARVMVEETVGTRARINAYIQRGPLEDASIVGWIDKRSLAEIGLASADGRSTELQGVVENREWAGCSAERPLLVDAGRGHEPVGTILVGTRVSRDTSSSGRRLPAGFVAVTLDGPARRSSKPPIVLARGARWIMAASDAADCGLP